MKTDSRQERYDLAREMQTWHPIARGLTLAVVSSVLSTLLVVLVEAISHEMVNDRVSTFARTALIAAVVCLLASAIARRYFLAILIPGALGFGAYWWWTKVGSKPMVHLMSFKSQALFTAHYPASIILTGFMLTLFQRRFRRIEA